MASLNFVIATLSLLLLLPYSTAAVTYEYKEASGCSDVELLTKDIISLTIKEIRHSRDFVHSIPRLRTVKHHLTPGIQSCVGDLFDHLSDIREALYRLKHLKSTRQDVDRLKGLVYRLGGFSTACQIAERHLDMTIVKVLHMKLKNSKILLQDVLHQLSLLEHK